MCPLHHFWFGAQLLPALPSQCLHEGRIRCHVGCCGGGIDHRVHPKCVHGCNMVCVVLKYPIATKTGYTCFRGNTLFPYKNAGVSQVESTSSMRCGRKFETRCFSAFCTGWSSRYPWCFSFHHVLFPSRRTLLSHPLVFHSPPPSCFGNMNYLVRVELKNGTSCILCLCA